MVSRTSGAAAGAKAAATTTLEGSLLGGHPAVLLLGVALTPITTLAGAVYGAVAAPPVEDVEAALRALRTTYDAGSPTAEQRLRDGIRDRLAREYKGLVFTRDTSSPGGENADTILEVSVTRIALEGLNGINPDLRLNVLADVEVLRKGRPPEHYTFGNARAPSFTLLTWATEGGRKFREAVDRELDRLADKILDYLLSSQQSPASQD